MLMSTGKLAKKYAVNYVTIANWIRAGKINAIKTLGGHYRVEESEFRKLLGYEEGEAE